MDIQAAADACRTKIIKNGGVDWVNNYNDDYNLSLGHIVGMLDQIVSGDISGEKAHRWLGWVQACMCFGRVALLGELKQINKDA